MTASAPVTEDPRAWAVNKCLWLNAFALAFSLMHVMGDFALVTILAPDPFWIQGIFVAFAAFLYGWWGWSLAQVGRDRRSGLVSLFILSLTAVANGASIGLCPPPCGGTSPYKVWPDVSHLGSLVFGVLAA